MTVRAEVTPGAAGHNVVGYLRGRRATAPIVVGAHHDGWFRAAFDNATGVAALLAIARGARRRRPPPAPPPLLHLADRRGVRPPRPRVRLVRRRLAPGERDPPRVGRAGAVPPLPRGERAPGPAAHARGPAELTGWARAAGRAGEAEGWLTSGWRTHAPTTGTELWPLLVAGVPGVTAFNWETSFARSVYHTPLDTPEIVDFDHLERLTRFYAYLLLDADRDPDGILDHGARARQLAKQAGSSATAARRCRAAAEAHGAARGRRAFTRGRARAARRRADGETGYPHEQAATDAAALEAALAALRATTGGRREAARQGRRRTRSPRTSPRRPSPCAPRASGASTTTTRGRRAAT